MLRHVSRLAIPSAGAVAFHTTASWIHHVPQNPRVHPARPVGPMTYDEKALDDWTRQTSVHTSIRSELQLFADDEHRTSTCIGVESWSITKLSEEERTALIGELWLNGWYAGCYPYSYSRDILYVSKRAVLYYANHYVGVPLTYLVSILFAGWIALAVAAVILSVAETNLM